MKNQDLINALVEKKLLTEAEGQKVLTQANTSRKSVEDVIYNQNLLAQEKVAEVKGTVLNIPYKKIDTETITEDVFNLIPRETARIYKLVPLSRTPETLIIGMVNPDDVNAQEALRFLAKQQKTNLGVYVITPADAELVLKKFSQFAGEIDSALRALKRKPGELSVVQKLVRLDEDMASGTTDSPIIRIVTSLLHEAVNVNASDIHIEPQRDRTRIRFRIEGDLQEASSLPAELAQSIVARIKVLSSMKLDETRIPQDGRFRTIIFEKEIDFRVSTFPTPSGEKVALRVLDPHVGLKSLQDIGISGRNEKLLRSGINRPFGMILLTGPTGSGKTTTLYALMQILNEAESNIVSLEDPVEYTISGVNQSQVRPEIGYSFASGLRQILRQDPDMIMVGEIRDSETAGLAVHAALTGHIVLSTLHTNNAIGVIPRLMDMKVSPFLLPSALSLMAAQRLLSRLCAHCKEGSIAPPPVEEIITLELEKIKGDEGKKFKAPYTIFHSKGCARCKGKGVLGRIAIFEIFEMTSAVGAILVKPSFGEQDLLVEARAQGMISLRQDGVLKALEGLVNIEEVIRETEEL